MAFTALRNKRNARWNQKLTEIFQVNLLTLRKGKVYNFQEWDKNHSGSISLEQMAEIYRIYKVG